MIRSKPYKDIIKGGDRYGFLVLTGAVRKGDRSTYFVECICDCGSIVEKRFDGLIKHTTKSCGSKICKLKSQEIQMQQGVRYGRLVLTGEQKYKGRRRYVEFLCDCGNIGFCALGDIRSGHTKSCGCLRTEILREILITHGHTVNKIIHPIYNTWAGIKQRCFNVRSDYYSRYGGRGISMFAEWYLDFSKFYEWSIDNGWADGLTLDRVDNNKSYEPSNCRWVTNAIQNRNKKNNINIDAFGEVKCAADWVKDYRCKIGACGLIKRIKKGWNHELAITTIPMCERNKIKVA